MTDLVVRRLLVDMQAPIPRHWCAGDAFRTALFNALSMSFPVGEQFFIDSVRTGVQALLDAERARFDVGRSTNNDVLLRQQELRTAELQVARAAADVAIAETALSALTGDILEHYSVKLIGL